MNRPSLDSYNGAVEEEHSDEQDEEDEVGERGGDVNHLPARLNPLGEAREHDAPREEYAETVVVVTGLSYLLDR